MLDFFMPKENSVNAVHDISCPKMRTRVRLLFRHLNERKFRDSSKDINNLICFCGFAPETTDLALRTKFCPDT